MPFHLPPISRRRFLLGAIAAGAGVVFRRDAGAAEADPHRWALLADPHIAADPAALRQGINMTDHLRRVAAEVLARPSRPAGVILDGDCAVTQGEPGDYANLAGLLKPFGEGGLPVHLTLGNHDHRDNFRDALARGSGVPPVEGRHISLIESPRANWFILDSLDQVNKTPGRLEEAQRRWLAAALDARSERPALVVLHHNPLFTTPGKMGGLLDTTELFELLVPRKHVKAVFYGHVHKWERRVQDGIHVVGLPPVGYVFTAGDPNGWVEARLASGGAALELRCLDPAHPAHASVVELAWRDG
jgi:3',5'-cyclic-AMP phosphodiesterase